MIYPILRAKFVHHLVGHAVQWGGNRASCVAPSTALGEMPTNLLTRSIQKREIVAFVQNYAS